MRRFFHTKNNQKNHPKQSSSTLIMNSNAKFKPTTKPQISTPLKISLIPINSCICFSEIKKLIKITSNGNWIPTNGSLTAFNKFPTSSRHTLLWDTPQNEIASHVQVQTFRFQTTPNAYGLEMFKSIQTRRHLSNNASWVYIMIISPITRQRPNVFFLITTEKKVSFIPL